MISNPDFFPTIPSIASLGGSQTTQTIQQISPSLRAPYVIQSAVSLERELPFKTTIAITYANTHGLHLLRSEVNPGPVFLMESSGLYNQNLWHDSVQWPARNSDRSNKAWVDSNEVRLARS